MAHRKVAETRSDKKWWPGDMLEVLANTVVVIILQYRRASSQQLCTLNLHNVTCQLHLSSEITHKGIWYTRTHTKYLHWDQTPY